MKRIIIFLILSFCRFSYADIEVINWYNEDGSKYATTTCDVGGDVILPTTPTKYGYTFTGWKRKIRQIEYLQGDIANQYGSYILTGIKSGPNTKFRIKFSAEGSGGEFISDLNNTMKYMCFVNNDTIVFRASGFTDVKIPFKANTIYDLEIGPMYIKNYETDNILVGVEQTANVQGSSELTIEWPSKQVSTVYLVQLWENNVKIRDFVPVLDATDRPCMYERTQGKFYYPKIGNLIAGPIIVE